MVSATFFCVCFYLLIFLQFRSCEDHFQNQQVAMKLAEFIYYVFCKVSEKSFCAFTGAMRPLRV